MISDMCTIIEEEWRDIEGYYGLYQVSNLGRFKSLDYNHTGKEKILKPRKNRKGYFRVSLYKNGKHNQYQAHRLVAEAFVPNPNNLHQVNHKDENKENNRLDNLEWCDPKYNTNYGTRNERIIKNMTGPYKSKQVLCVETGEIYYSSYEAARKTGAGQSNIIACCRGKCGYKTAKGYHWRYVN